MDLSIILLYIVFFFLSPVTEKWVDKNDKKSSLNVPNKSVRLASKSSLSHFHLFLLIQFLLALCLIIQSFKVTPAFKSRALSDPSKNQPIASLSPFSKILKRVIYDQLVKYFDEDPVIFKNQPGLRKSHSTEQAIMEITDNLKASIDRNVISCGFFLDFSKAFHTINNQIL